MSDIREEEGQDQFLETVREETATIRSASYWLLKRPSCPENVNPETGKIKDEVTGEDTTTSHSFTFKWNDFKSHEDNRERISKSLSHLQEAIEEANPTREYYVEGTLTASYSFSACVTATSAEEAEELLRDQDPYNLVGGDVYADEINDYSSEIEDIEVDNLDAREN